MTHRTASGSLDNFHRPKIAQQTEKAFAALRFPRAYSVARDSRRERLSQHRSRLRTVAIVFDFFRELYKCCTRDGKRLNTFWRLHPLFWKHSLERYSSRSVKHLLRSTQLSQLLPDKPHHQSQQALSPEEGKEDHWSLAFAKWRMQNVSPLPSRLPTYPVPFMSSNALHSTNGPML